MKKLIVNEINHIRKMMGLNEQTAVDAVKSGVESSLKGSDDEYKLMGHIITFMGMEGPNGSTDDRMDWIEKYRSPIGKFGKSLFDYLHGNNSSYDTDFFNKLMKVFETPGIFNNTPSDDKLIEIGKSVTEFKYNN